MKENKNKGFGLQMILLALMMSILLLIVGIAAVFFFSESSTEKLIMPLFGINEEQAHEPEKKESTTVNQKLKDAEAEIASLERMLESKEQEAAKSEHIITQLEGTIKDLERASDTKEMAAGEILATYEEMMPKRAALLMQEMEKDEAVEVLTAITTETRAAILEKMDPVLAARLMEKASVESGANNPN